ncbi:MAG: transcriptional regulator PpsR [Sphingomonadaceae bacterium]
MTDLSASPDTGLRFSKAEKLLGALDAQSAAAIAAAAGDIALVLDEDGKILDVATSGGDFNDLGGWVGRPWIDTVTVESRPKIEEMLAMAANGRAARWRQVNHPADGEKDIPVRYFTVGIGKDGRTVAIGRDVRATAALQQRLLQAQQSLERDYLRLRQAEARYRLLFEMTSEPVIIIEADGHRIRELNPAAGRLLGTGKDGISGRRLPELFEKDDRDKLIAYLGAAAAAADALPASLAPAGGGETVRLWAKTFRQSGKNYYLLGLLGEGRPEDDEPSRRLVQVIERMPDGFVLADSELDIVTANTAFVDLAGAGGLDQLRGRSLREFIGRPRIDLDLILGQLAEHGVARNVATVVRGIGGGKAEVELSAVSVPEAGGYYGFSLRGVGRRLRDLPPSERDLPRSVDQLTDLVGRMPLKEIVRESTDLIERLCIEAALAYTSNNRASAAEILGLSRQSLYSKLHRYGIAGGGANGR